MDTYDEIQTDIRKIEKQLDRVQQCQNELSAVRAEYEQEDWHLKKAIEEQQERWHKDDRMRTILQTYMETLTAMEREMENAEVSCDRELNKAKRGLREQEEECYARREKLKREED